MTLSRRTSLICASLAALVAAACAGPAAAQEATAPPDPAASADTPFEPGEVLVRFRSEPEPGTTYELPDGIGVRRAARALNRNPEVDWAVPNYTAAAAAWIPNDRGERSAATGGGWQEVQWNFLPCGSTCGGKDDEVPYQSFGGIDAPKAWGNLIDAGRPGGRHVKVAVVDTGVAYRKRGNKYKRSPDLRRGQFVSPRDFAEGDKVPLDQNGHGTHVASTIGERTDNHKFVTGLAYGAKLIPVRVLDKHGQGSASTVSRGIRYAAHKGADVINLSLEFSRQAVDECADIPTVCEAINHAHDQGALVVSVSGNTGGSNITFPGRAANVLAVGATTKRGCLADYSAFGKGLDIVAPGGGEDTGQAGPQCEPFEIGPGITQLTLRHTRAGYTEFGYPYYDGTSMAAAHVSGVAALTWAAMRKSLGRQPTAAEVEQRLKATARTERGLDNQQLYGAGLIDAGAATAF